MQLGDQNLRDVLSDNLISDHSETGIVITILLPASNLPCPEWFALPTKIAWLHEAKNYFAGRIDGMKCATG